VTAKPTVSELGIDLAAQVWQRSGHGDGAIEVAFAHTSGPSGSSVRTAATSSSPAATSSSPAATSGASVPADRTDWVLMRVAGDPDQRVLVFDRHEWECFLDGARNGEFDDAVAPKP
jgi:hypothetical protein